MGSVDLVEALTRKSARFLFLRRPNTMLADSNGRVVLDLPNKDQLSETMSRGGTYLDLLICGHIYNSHTLLIC